ASAFRGDGLVLAGAIHTIRGLAINGFRGNGILAAGGNSLASFPQLTISGNDIGTDPTGEVAIPNLDRGIRVIAGQGVIQNNVISGNGRSGVFVDSGVVSVLENRIGVSASGAALGNGASGIFYGRTDATFLMLREIRGNVIANNRDFAIAAVTGVDVVVRENSMHDNGGLAYDIGLDGVSPTPSGLAAGLVERPLVISARYDAVAGDTIIDLLLNATPPAASHTTYTLYLFASSHLNRGGYAEGETFLAKGSGNLVLGEVRVHSDLRGQYITALTERFVDFGDLQLTASSELSDGVRVP
ncbi:MAG TPA: right-handed parallel beta-helix repeat-containing protein, partial [Thermoanaerobaculia bacterium]